MNNKDTKVLDLIQMTEEFEQVRKIISEMSASNRPLLGGEHFITDIELSTLLKVSRRTLQQWRSDGVIPYYNIGGKVLYRESDVERLLESYYIKAYQL